MTGGAFFQVEVTSCDSKKVNIPPTQWSIEFVNYTNVIIYDTDFAKNQAEAFGGGLYINSLRSFNHLNCTNSIPKRFLGASPDFKDSFKCKSFFKNTVSEKGYGADIATDASDFTLTILNSREKRTYQTGETIEVPNWKSGDAFPLIQVMLLDDLRQGPAAKRSKTISGTCEKQDPIAQFDKPVRITVKASDKSSSLLVTDVKNGVGTISIGRPFQPPGIYNLFVWFEEDRKKNITISIHVRECIINEESTLNGTFCSKCASNQYNFHPDKEPCQRCPENANCSTVFMIPQPGHWNAFPCSNHTQRCFNPEACQLKTPFQRVERHNDWPIDCEFSDDVLVKYREALCKDGYTGPLCGSCEDEMGRQGTYECRRCLGTLASVGMVIVSILTLSFLVVSQIRGTLNAVSFPSKSSKPGHFSRLFLRAATRRIDTSDSFAIVDFCTREENRQKMELYQRKKQLAKWKFVELIKVCFLFAFFLNVWNRSRSTFCKPRRQGRLSMSLGTT